MASRRTRRRTRRRRLVRIVGVLAGLLVLVAIGLQVAGPTLVQPALVVLLERQGLAPVRLQVASVGLTGIGIADLTVGGATAARADVALSPLGLLGGRADRLTLRGLRLAATLGDDGVSIRGFSGGGSGGTLPVERIELDDAEIAVATPFGATTVRLDGTVTPTGSGLTAQLARASIAAPSLNLRAADITATLELAGDRVRLDASGQVTDTQKPARVVPLAATLQLDKRGDAVTIAASARDAKGQLAITAKGQHALAAGRGAVLLSATPKAFGDALQPRDLSPLLGEGVPPLDGTIAVAGTLGWSRAGLQPDLTITVKDLAIDLGAARIAGANGAVKLDGLAPPSTPPGQRLTGSLAVGTASLPMALEVALRRDGAIAVSSLTLGFADGELTLSDIVVPPGAPAELALPVQVHGTDLSALLGLLAIDGLSGDGQLDGVLPLRLTRDAGGALQIALDHGQLAARGPGTVRYVGGALPRPAGGGGEAVGLLSDALKDFHYRSLTIELDRRPDGADGAMLHLNGANPAVLNGRPFVLNIKLDADFDRLATIFLAGFDAAGRLARDLSKK